MHRLAIGLAVLLALGVAGCQNAEEEAWAQAQKDKTLDSYRAYIEAYPEGRHLRTANQYLERELWVKAEKDKSIAACEQYLEWDRKTGGKYRTHANFVKEMLEKEKSRLKEEEAKKQRAALEAKFKEAADRRRREEEEYFERVIRPRMAKEAREKKEREEKEEGVRNRLNPHLEEYAAWPKDRDQDIRKPYIRGKIVLVKRRGDKLQGGWWVPSGPSKVVYPGFVPPELRASRPEEVGTVLQLAIEDRTRLSPTGNPNWYYRVLDGTNHRLWFIDHVQKTVVGEKTWVFRQGGEFKEFRKMEADIEAYLCGLPRKPLKVTVEEERRKKERVEKERLWKVAEKERLERQRREERLSKEWKAVRNRLNPHLEEYAAWPKRRDRDIQRPYIRGKIALVERNTEKKKYYWLAYPRFVPPELRASRPEEVGTVLWLEIHSIEVGISEVLLNGTKIPVYKRDYHLTFIDHVQKTIVGENVVFQAGRKPPWPKPKDKDIETYIRGLPRKPLKVTGTPAGL